MVDLRRHTFWLALAVFNAWLLGQTGDSFTAACAIVTMVMSTLNFYWGSTKRLAVYVPYASGFGGRFMAVYDSPTAEALEQMQEMLDRAKRAARMQKAVPIKDDDEIGGVLVDGTPTSSSRAS